MTFRFLSVISIIATIILLSFSIIIVSNNIESHAAPPNQPINDIAIATASDSIHVPVVSYTDFTYPLDEKIQTVLDKYYFDDQQLSYFYYSFNDQQEIAHNSNTTMVAASTIKVPLAMYYYDKVNKHELSLEDTFTFTSSAYEIGGELPNDYSIGSKIPLATLLEYMIVYSDNSATNILIQQFSSFREYRESVLAYAYTNIQPNYPNTFLSNNYTTASIQKDILTYLFNNQDNYKKLIQDMKQAAKGLYLQDTSYPVEIAHKYGDFDGYLLDYGIVYDEYPYIIGIDTNGIPNAENLIAELGNVFYEYHVAKYNWVESTLSTYS